MWHAEGTFQSEANFLGEDAMLSVKASDVMRKTSQARVSGSEVEIRAYTRMHGY